MTKQCHLLIMQCSSRGLEGVGSCFVMPHTTFGRDTSIQKDNGPVEPLDTKLQIPGGNMSVLFVYGSCSLFKWLINWCSVLPKYFSGQLKLEFSKPKFDHFPSLESLLDFDHSQDEE